MIPKTDQERTRPRRPAGLSLSLFLPETAEQASFPEVRLLPQAPSGPGKPTGPEPSVENDCACVSDSDCACASDSNCACE